MIFDLSLGKITLVLCPIDMRAGFEKLASIAQTYLNIDIYKEKDWVVFISKNQTTVKIIHCDNKGSLLIKRKLNSEKFQLLMTKVTGTPERKLTKDEFESYLNGDNLEVKRTSFFRN